MSKTKELMRDSKRLARVLDALRDQAHADDGEWDHALDRRASKIELAGLKKRHDLVLNLLAIAEGRDEHP